MISVDTNVVVRLLTGDDQVQFTRAKALFSKKIITITTSVILECEWVLRYAYHFKPLKIADAFQSLFGISNVNLQEQLVIYDAIQWYKQGLDFADAIHLVKSQDSESFATFDKKLIKAASKAINFPVLEP
ncbi:MAG: type II toxin-antitoxin system VapC family toxin [Desulfobacterales bacterium]|jgi:predicted nucleic-acid-binding protein